MQEEDYISAQPARPFQTVPQPHHGGCTEVGYFDNAGMPGTGGAAIQTGPLEWGAHGTAPEDAAWCEVTKLGNLDGSLWAAYEKGILYLSFGEPEHSGGGNETPNGSGYVGGVGENDIAFGTGRDITPDLFLAGIDVRDSFLKAAGGQWRAWANWDILLTAMYITGPWQEGYGEYPAEVLTVWVVTVGNVLCFIDTTEALVPGQDWHVKNWTAYGGITRAYGAAPTDVEDGRIDTETRTHLTCGKVVPLSIGADYFNGGFAAVAPLPWQFEGKTAVYDIEQDENFCLGTLGMQSPFRDSLDYPMYSSQCVSPGLLFCPRLHFVGTRYTNRKSSGVNEADIKAIFFGEESDFDIWDGHYYLKPRYGWTRPAVAPGFSMLFDPVCVEWYGQYNDGDWEFTRTDADMWLPQAASDWVLVAETTLRGPMGNVYLMIAGAHANDCLLTGSASTELFNN
ncbi:MAG: hypothetical protein MJ074_06405 [Oscillospiraceae bacterium]|nr:hypothetical protein [Oscillospiraceae bacterium]